MECSDPNNALGVISEGSETCQAIFDLGQGGPEPVEQGYSRFGRRNGTCRAREKTHTKPLLKRSHGMAQRGGRDVQLRSRSREAS